MPPFSPPTFTTSRTVPSRVAVVAHGLTEEALGADLPGGLAASDLKRLGFTAGSPGSTSAQR